MRIALVCEGFGRIGGVQEVVHNLAVEFGRLGHTVTVISDPYMYPASENARRAGVEVRELQIPSLKRLTLRHPERVVSRGRARELERFLLEATPDVVGSHLWNWDKFPTLSRACARARVPVVVSLHDTSGRGQLGDRALSSLRTVCALTAVSAATRSDFETHLPWARNGFVIPSGVNCAEALAARAHERERPYVFCAARLDLRHKAIDALISAFRMVAPQYPQIDLVIAGDGPDRARLERQADESGLGARVEFARCVSRSELWSLHKGALFFAMPSRMREGLGIVFLEAMACGRPAIGTKIGGVPEVIIDGNNGLLVEPDDCDALASCMSELIANAELREKMGRRAQETVAANFTWERVAARYAEVYRSCAQC